MDGGGNKWYEVVFLVREDARDWEVERLAEWGQWLTWIHLEIDYETFVCVCFAGVFSTSSYLLFNLCHFSWLIVVWMAASKQYWVDGQTLVILLFFTVILISLSMRILARKLFLATCPCWHHPVLVEDVFNEATPGRVLVTKTENFYRIGNELMKALRKAKSQNSYIWGGL